MEQALRSERSGDSSTTLVAGIPAHENHHLAAAYSLMRNEPLYTLDHFGDQSRSIIPSSTDGIQRYLIFRVLIETEATEMFTTHDLC